MRERAQDRKRGEIAKLTGDLCPEIREGVVSDLLEFQRRGEIASENEGSESVDEEGYLKLSVQIAELLPGPEG